MSATIIPDLEIFNLLPLDNLKCFLGRRRQLFFQNILNPSLIITHQPSIFIRKFNTPQTKYLRDWRMTGHKKGRSRAPF
jgi:hypothetical protein